MVISMQKWRQKREPMYPLSETDWRVVDMARADGPRSFNPDGWLASLWRIIGISVAHGLANESLETLRRFSIRAWYWDVIRQTDVRQLFDAGYSTTHVLQILAHVASFRGFTPSLEQELA
jgi:hypothetical protein